MKLTVEALGPKSGNRLLAAGAAGIMIPCVHGLADTIARAARVHGPVTAHVPANGVVNLAETAQRLADNGITRILAIAGNPGRGYTRYGVYDLIEYFSHKGFEVSVGSYPEAYLGMSSARHRDRSARIVAKKQAAGAHRVITQASFNAANMGKWLVSVRNHGTTLPIHIGVMPAVPWRVTAKIMVRTLAENRNHPVRLMNMPNIDLLFRTLRSRVHDTVRFIHGVYRVGALCPDDAFHIFSHGVRVDELIDEALAMAR